MNPEFVPWSDGEANYIKAVWPDGKTKILLISKTLLKTFGTVRSPDAINSKARKMGLRRERNRTNWGERYEPSEAVWLEAATQAALQARVRPSLVLGPSSRKDVVRARWAAWRAILEMNPRYSMAGLGRVSGFDHTTILYAMSRSGVTRNWPHAKAS